MGAAGLGELCLPIIDKQMPHPQQTPPEKKENEEEIRNKKATCVHDS